MSVESMTYMYWGPSVQVLASDEVLSSDEPVSSSEEDEEEDDLGMSSLDRRENFTSTHLLLCEAHYSFRGFSFVQMITNWCHVGLVCKRQAGTLFICPVPAIPLGSISHV